MSTENAWHMADKLREILQSDYFDKDAFDERRLKLSQAFCLLWQNKDTGEVAGRQKSGPTAAGAAVAVLLDLLIMGKIEFEAEMKQWMTRKREIIYVKVADSTPSSTFLDNAIFYDILSHSKVEPNKPKTVVEWIIQASCSFPTCATEVLESLVDMGILSKSSLLFWRKYPTINPGPEVELIDEIKRIALSGYPADGYIWTLLKLMRDVDACAFRKGSLLARHFSSSEFVKANACIENLTCAKEQRIERQECIDLHELHVITPSGIQTQEQEMNGPQEGDSQIQEEESCKLEDVKIEDKESDTGDDHVLEIQESGPKENISNADDFQVSGTQEGKQEERNSDQLLTESQTPEDLHKSDEQVDADSDHVSDKEGEPLQVDQEHLPVKEEEPAEVPPQINEDIQEGKNVDQNESPQIDQEENKDARHGQEVLPGASLEQKKSVNQVIQDPEAGTTDQEEPQVYKLDEETLATMERRELNTKM